MQHLGRATRAQKESPVDRRAIAYRRCCRRRRAGPTRRLAAPTDGFLDARSPRRDARTSSPPRHPTRQLPSPQSADGESGCEPAQHARPRSAQRSPARCRKPPNQAKRNVLRRRHVSAPPSARQRTEGGFLTQTGERLSQTPGLPPRAGAGSRPASSSDLSWRPSSSQNRLPRSSASIRSLAADWLARRARSACQSGQGSEVRHAEGLVAFREPVVRGCSATGWAPQ